MVEIGFTRKSGQSWYDVTLASGDGLTEEHIDPATGTLIDGSARHIPLANLDPQGQRDLHAVLSAATTLSQATVAAEHAAHGQAISAGVEQLGGVPQYYVQIVNAGKLVPMTVDLGSGRAAAPMK